MTAKDGASETFWDLLTDIARLQAKIGDDLALWSQANEANARAFKSNADTLRLLAEIGRRTEQSMRYRPSAAARLAMQLFSNPLEAMGASPGAAGDTFARFWDAWRAAAESHDPGQ